MDNKRSIRQLIGRLFGNRPPLAAGRDFIVEIGDCPPLAMVAIPAGVFQMGSDKRRDPRARDDELPQHKVHLDAYAIGKYSVTNAQYAQFVRSTQHRSAAPWQRDGQVREGEENHPVVNVSWDDAVAFCQWSGMRLPTEAEWEKATRGKDGRIFPWGDAPPTPILCNFVGSEIGHTTPVGSYPSGASPYGVMDMAGNVWDWVADWYHEDYYRVSPASNPTGPTTGERRVLRGGSCHWISSQVWAAYRDSDSPFEWGPYNGFRCARSL